jgi:hypothetical protein
MAEKGERRSPTSHRTKTQMKRKARSKTQNASKEATRKRGCNNAARDKLKKEGKVKKGDGKHVDHKKPMAKGGSCTKRSNLRVTSAKKNVSHGMANQHTKKKKKAKGK